MLSHVKVHFLYEIRFEPSFNWILLPAIHKLGYCELCSFYISVGVLESFSCSQTNSKITQLKGNKITMGHTQPLCSTLLYMNKSIDVILAHYAILGGTEELQIV
jgi:hypothetical protein